MTDEYQEKPKAINNKARLLLLAYGITLLVLLPYVKYFAFFPFGLLYYFSSFSFLDNIDSFLMIGIGWVIYLIITLSMVVSRRKTVFIVLYCILVILLIFNIGGCYAQNLELNLAFPNL